MATLTVANSIIMLGITGIYSAAQQLEGFEVDDVFATEAVVSAETKMGVDGNLSAGWVPTSKKTTFTLQADSPSNLIFDTWAQTQEAAKELYPAFAVIILPGLGTKYALVKGFLDSYIPIPEAKKIMQSRRFGIIWQSILPAPV